MERCLGASEANASPANVNAYRTWCATVGDMDQSIQQMQQQEEDDGGGEDCMDLGGGGASKSVSRARKGARSDKAAVMQLKMKKASGKSFFMKEAE